MRKLLSFELLIHLSYRDLFKVLAEVDPPTLLRAYKNVEPKYLAHIQTAFEDDALNSRFTKDLNALEGVVFEESLAARMRIAEIADQLLSENELEDWHLRRA